MSRTRPQLLLACNEYVRDHYIAATDLAALESFVDWHWFPCSGGGIYDSNDDQALITKLRHEIGGYNGLAICHGAPKIDADIMAAAPELGIIIELEGDRFAGRIDLDAAWERGIRTVDVTNGSSYPVAEWALGLILLSMRNAGEHFRHIIAGHTTVDPAALSRTPGSLMNKRVGLIGCGHMGRRLIKLLRPFETDIGVHDPFLPVEMAEALGFLQTSLEKVLTRCDVVVCLVPLTPATRGLLGERELAMLPAGAVFVNVSRGAVVDSAALIDRLRQGGHHRRPRCL